MAWAVKNWEASGKPNEKGEYVRIDGGQEGIIAWLKSCIGIAPSIRIVVTAKVFCLEVRTFWGCSRRTIPISRISEVRDGFKCAWLLPLICWFLSGLFGGLLVFRVCCGSIPAGFNLLLFLITALFGKIGCRVYRCRYRLVIGVAGFGGAAAVASFKPSGQNIDADTAERTGTIIRTLIEN